MGWKRILHDAAHIALIPFSVAVVAGQLSTAVQAYVERADLVVHLVLLALTIHSLHDWIKLKSRNKSEAHREVRA